MKRSLLALTLLAALPFAASAAEGISYNYVEAGYIGTNTDGGDADGFAINGSGAIAPNFHIFGGYSGQKTDDFVVGPTRFVINCFVIIVGTIMTGCVRIGDEVILLGSCQAEGRATIGLGGCRGGIADSQSG